MTDNRNDSDTVDVPDEIELLLPWYLTGTLDSEDRERVETYLANHPHVRAQLDLIDEEAGASIAQNEAIDGPTAGALDRFMEQVAAEPAPRRTTQAAVGRLGGWLSDLANAFASPAMKVAGGLAALLIVVQAITLGSLVMTDKPGTYIPASGGEEQVAPSGPAFLVRLAPSASSATLTQALQQAGLRVADGPRQGGFYRVEARDPKAESDPILRQLRARTDIFSLVVPAERKAPK